MIKSSFISLTTASLICLTSYGQAHSDHEVTEGPRGGAVGGQHQAAPRSEPVSRPASLPAAYSLTPSLSRVQPAAPTGRTIQSLSRSAATKNNAHPYTQNRELLRQQLNSIVQTRAAHPAVAQKAQDKGWMARHNQTNSAAVSQVRSRVSQTHPQRSAWFGNSFFARHNYQPYYNYNGANWWQGANWAVVNNWINPGWAYPIYYDTGGYQVVLPPEPYQAPMPPQTYSGNDWLPLGVFAAGKNFDQAAYSNMFVQLAVNRGGDIAGTYYNSSTDQTHPLEGIIINETQQVAWTVADRPNSPLMTTGMYDLTQDQAPVVIHYPDGSEQSWVLIRLSQ